MDTARIRARLAIPPRVLLTSVITVVVAAAVVFAVFATLGAVSAQSMYFSMLLLLTPARRIPATWQWAAGAWALAVAIGGYLVGPLGLWAVLLGLVAVSVGQAAFSFGHAAGIARSPVNFLLFATFSARGAPLWQVAVGAALGIAFMFAAGRLLRGKAISEPVIDPPAERLGSGLLLAAGSVVIVGVGELLHYTYVKWALLSLCMILAVDVAARTGRAKERIVGSTIGALLATALAQLPQPVTIALIAVCAVLSVSYIGVGDFTLFILFLTPTVLLTAAGQPSYVVALHQVIAVLLAAALAALLTWIGHLIGVWQRDEALADGSSPLT